jgi:peptide/nickel transport system permease protein
MAKNILFIGGLSVCLLFIFVGILGYGIAVDSSPNANQIMPEWSSKSLNSTVYYVQYKRLEPRKWYFWISGDGTQGEILSVKPNTYTVEKNGIVGFTNEKTGLPTRIAANLLEPGLKVRKFRLGSDHFGRDIYSRLVIGSRISLSIGFFAMLISLIIGILIGLLSGYFGGKLDVFFTWLITVFWSVPTLLIALGLSAFLGKGFFQVLIATGLSSWVEVARVVRGQTMQLRKREFILSAQITGFSHFRIMFKHILPNLFGTLTVLATTNFAAAILLEAGLSFLGLGVSPTTPSWGMMVKDNLGYLVMGKPYLAIIPGLAIMLLVMAFNLMTMGLKNEEEKQLMR